jgi:nucleotide-binding universal stress UspA family protein
MGKTVPRPENVRPAPMPATYFVDEDTRRQFETAPTPRSEGTMQAIRKILVPTDFSAHADEAFRVAHTLAGALGADVVLFHVARPPAVAAEGGSLLADSWNGTTANLWDRFQPLRPPDSKVRVGHEVIVSDRPGADHVLDILEKLGCDLIVMGTHGHSRLRHLLFGSVTEEVVRRARCPVMVVKSPDHQAATPAPEAPTQAGATHAG